jgi:hypothetical protein
VGFARLDVRDLPAAVRRGWPRVRVVAVRWAWLVILLTGTVLITVSSVLRVEEAAVTLRIQCDSVGFALDREWAWDGRIRSADSAAVENVSRIESALFADGVRGTPADAWLRLEGGSTSLDRLDLATAVRLEMEIDDENGVSFSITGGPAAGQLQATGAPRVAAGNGRGVATLLYPPPLEPPEAVTFRTIGTDARPATVRMRIHSPAVLPGFLVNELWFRRRVAPRPGLPEWQSTIHEGTARLGDVSREEKLEEGQHLRLDGVRGRVISVRIGDTIDVLFDGRARSVRTGFDERPARELKPTVLASWHQKYKHFEPGALLVTLAGFAISLRKWAS